MNGTIIIHLALVSFAAHLSIGEFHDLGIHHLMKHMEADDFRNNNIMPWYLTLLEESLYKCMGNKHLHLNYLSTLHYIDKAQLSCSKPCMSLDLGRNIYKSSYNPEPLIGLPCGDITFRREPHFIREPWSKSWKIRVRQNMKVTATVLHLDLFYNDYKCVHNYVELLQNNGHITSTIARLCGRSRGRIFYSTESEINLHINLVTNPPRTQYMVFIYQEYDPRLLNNIITQHGEGKHLVTSISYSMFTAVFRNNAIESLTFTSAVHQIISLSAAWNNCSGDKTGLLVFDGPDTNAKLLVAAYDKTRHLEIHSTLFKMTVLKLNMAEDCFYFHYSSSNRIDSNAEDIFIETLNVFKGKFSYTATHFNLFKSFRVRVPKNRFVVMKLTEFTYNGPTESRCAYGGIILISDNEKYGPLCGVLGHTLLQSRGLTFQRDYLEILIYMFSGEYYLSGTLMFSSSECEGIIDICAIIEKYHITGQQRYFSRHYALEIIDKNLAILKHRKRSVGNCFHIQGFNHNMNSNGCAVLFENTMEKSPQYEAKLSLNVDSSVGQFCYQQELTQLMDFIQRQNAEVKSFDDFFLSVIKSNGISEGVVTGFRLLNNTFSVERTFEISSILVININSKFCSTIDNDAFTLILKLKDDPCYRVKEKRDFLTGRSYHDVENPCSEITLMKYNGVFCIKYLSMRPFDNFKMKFFIDFSGILRQNSGSHVVHMDIEGSSFVGILTWTITKPHFHWELTNNEDDVIDVILFLVLNADTDNMDLDTVTQGLMNEGEGTMMDYRNFFRLYKIKSPTNYKNDEASVTIVHVVEEFSMIQPSKIDDFFHNTQTDVYYYLESRPEVSWDMANKICKQKNKHLLSDNSEMEDESVKSIFLSSPLLAFSPVVFLARLSDKEVRKTKRYFSCRHFCV